MVDNKFYLPIIAMQFPPTKIKESVENGQKWVEIETLHTCRWPSNPVHGLATLSMA